MKTRLFFAGLFNIIGGLVILSSVALFIFGDKIDAIYFIITGLMGGKLAEDLSEGK